MVFKFGIIVGVCGKQDVSKLARGVLRPLEHLTRIRSRGYLIGDESQSIGFAGA